MSDPKMKNHWRLLASYAVAPVTVMLALAIRLSLNHVLGHDSPFMYFFVAILVSGWLGGLGPALLATILSVLVVDYFFLEPLYTVLGGNAREWVQIVSFVILGAIVSLIVSSLRSSLARAESAKSEAQFNEIRYRAIYEHADIGIERLDEAGHLLEVNPALCRMLGYTSEELLKRTFAEITHPDDQSEDQKLLEKLKRREIFSYKLEKRYVHQDGHPIWVRLTSSLAPEGAGFFRMSLVEDITELWRFREELEQLVRERTAQLQESFAHLEELNTKLETSNRELQDFAFVASHDLQEPLRKVMAFGDCLSGEFGPALGQTGKDYLRRMQSAATRMQTLISDLLQFSRVTTKAQPAMRVELAQVVSEVLSDLELSLSQSGGSVEIGNLPAIEADALQMRQLLQNLIGNAIKFARREAPPRVRVYSEPESDNGRLRLCVEDNGIGFEEKYLDRIFTVFQRLHERGAYEGTGIGLAICRKIAERHGGSITARSRTGEGSVFIVTLPYRQPIKNRS